MCMCMCICMGTKTISIMNVTYNILKSRKHKNESFSDVIRRITNKNDIMQFAGILKNISDEDAEDAKKYIKNLRKSSTKELLFRIKRK